MRVRYIGSFPPPYGGVTNKNQLLYRTLSERTAISRLKESRFISGKLYQAVNILLAMLPGQILIIGISSKSGKSRTLTKLLYQFNRKTMERSLYFMMGGTEANRIAENADEIEWYRHYKKVYAETESMVSILNDAGLNNAEYFPNCREKYLKSPVWDVEQGKRLQCVFFSLIERQKGIDLIIEAAKATPNVDYYFYGAINPKDEVYFKKMVEEAENLFYKGVFVGNNEETYEELRKYDVLLFPTRWKTEGVPGIIVEAKMAGIAAIVSSKSYNAELVKDDVEGIVLKENTTEALSEAVERIDMDRALLERLKKNSYISSAEYWIENYTDNIINALETSGGGINGELVYTLRYADALPQSYEEVTAA